jgi:hypothetical protein
MEVGANVGVPVVVTWRAYFSPESTRKISENAEMSEGFHRRFNKDLRLSY